MGNWRYRKKRNLREREGEGTSNKFSRDDGKRKEGNVERLFKNKVKQNSK